MDNELEFTTNIDSKTMLAISRLAFGQTNQQLAQFAAQVDNPNVTIIGAVVDKQVVGFVSILDTRPTGDIILIAVNPKYQHNGIGSALLANIPLFLPEIQEIFLEVRPSNQHAIDLYNKSNFSLIDRRKNYYKLPTEDALIMRITYE